MEMRGISRVDGNEHINQFVKSGEAFSRCYYVSKTNTNKYGIVSRRTGVPFVEFKGVEKLTNLIWVLNINDNEKKLVDVSSITPSLSKTFFKVIKVFENYALIEYKNGEREFIDLSNVQPVRYEKFEPYSYFKLPNGRWSFVDMVNLRVSKEEFKLDSADFI